MTVHRPTVDLDRGLQPEVSGARWFRFIAGYLVLWGVLAGSAELDATGRWRLPILVGVAAAAVAVEMVLYRAALRDAVRRLGLGRPRSRAVLVALGVSGLVLLVYPLTAVVTGTRPTSVEGWPWLLVGLFAYHGLAEEIVWRGFVFRRVSQGRGFGTAVLTTMPFVVAAHLPMLVTAGPLVAAGALAVAAVTTVPLSHLYRSGRDTIWAPAVVHAAIDSFKLVRIPESAAPQFSLLLVGVSLGVPLLALLRRTGADRQGRPAR